MRRPRTKWFIKCLYVFFIVFLTFSLRVVVYFGEHPNTNKVEIRGLDGHGRNKTSEGQVDNITKNTSILYSVTNGSHIINSNFNFTIYDAEGANATNNLTWIREEILKINTEQRIYNLNRFNLTLNENSVVIIIQAHDRFEYLKNLIDSLKGAKKIEDSLLIISCSVFSVPLYKIAATIDFCPVMLIFFPFSIQLHPNSFPGVDPNDCPRNLKKEEAVEKKCNNAEHPDKYNHYREAKFCQVKHHWFWKLHHVFKEIHMLKDYKGLVLLLEDDYYVSPDVISVLQLMKNLTYTECKDCLALASGNYDKTQNYAENAGRVEVAAWLSAKHNLGMAFTVDLFHAIQKCAQEFCSHDDYNWDWTLQHLSYKCFTNQLKVLKMKASRVFHMGICGIHHTGENCNVEVSKNNIQAMLDNNKEHMFPSAVTIDGYSGVKQNDPRLNGGWGDPRDHQLCLSFLGNLTDS